MSSCPLILFFTSVSLIYGLWRTRAINSSIWGVVVCFFSLFFVMLHMATISNLRFTLFCEHIMWKIIFCSLERIIHWEFIRVGENNTPRFKLLLLCIEVIIYTCINIWAFCSCQFCIKELPARTAAKHFLCCRSKSSAYICICCWLEAKSSIQQFLLSNQLLPAIHDMCTSCTQGSQAYGQKHRLIEWESRNSGQM